MPQSGRIKNFFGECLHFIDNIKLLQEIEDKMFKTGLINKEKQKNLKERFETLKFYFKDDEHEENMTFTRPPTHLLKDAFKIVKFEKKI